jgi:hypothetical protein
MGEGPSACMCQHGMGPILLKFYYKLLKQDFVRRLTDGDSVDNKHSFKELAQCYFEVTVFSKFSKVQSMFWLQWIVQHLKFLKVYKNIPLDLQVVVLTNDY